MAPGRMTSPGFLIRSSGSFSILTRESATDLVREPAAFDVTEVFSTGPSTCRLITMKVPFSPVSTQPTMGIWVMVLSNVYSGSIPMIMSM